MVTMASLWLPILVSAVAVFFASFVMWMVLPHHKSDWVSVPDEDGLMNHLREQGIKPGQYVIPRATSKEMMKDPEFIKKYSEGPSGSLIIRPGGFNMGASMGKSLVFNLVVSAMVAYVASFTLVAASGGKDVFRLTSMVGFLCYAGALGWGPIWWNRTWSSTFKEMLDGLVYGLVIGAIFMALW